MLEGSHLYELSLSGVLTSLLILSSLPLSTPLHVHPSICPFLRTPFFCLSTPLPTSGPPSVIPLFFLPSFCFSFPPPILLSLLPSFLPSLPCFPPSFSPNFQSSIPPSLPLLSPSFLPSLPPSLLPSFCSFLDLSCSLALSSFPFFKIPVTPSNLHSLDSTSPQSHQLLPSSVT